LFNFAFIDTHNLYLLGFDSYLGQVNTYRGKSQYFFIKNNPISFNQLTLYDIKNKQDP
jgi:hypothetical protein